MPNDTITARPTREDPRYWHNRPEDHSDDGLYRDGPHMAGNRLRDEISSSEAPAYVPSPETARARQSCQRAEARRSVQRKVKLSGYAKLLAVLRTA